MKPNQRPPLRRQGNFVLPQWKLVYVSNPKAACSTIKWMLADLQGIDEKRIYSTARQETSRATTIHQHRGLWLPGTPRLLDLSVEQLAEITPENGWFVFSMTRHPAARLWSAWQSKLLIREPRYVTTYARESWWPRLPESTEDVIADWERFVKAVAASPRMPIMLDQHFRPQGALLSVGRTPYDRLYDTSEYPAMLADVRKHLEGLGWSGELTNRRSNETPLPPIERAFPPHVQDTIAQVFRRDFRQLSYDSPLPPKLRSGDYSTDLIAATVILTERAERIGDLSAQALELQKQLTIARRPRSLRSQLRPAIRRHIRRRLGRLRPQSHGQRP